MMPSSRVIVSKSMALVGLVERQDARADHEAGPDQRHPRSVDAQAGNFADGERQISPGEDRAGGHFHGVAANHASR